MATIVNERDKILQAASVRFVPPVIPQDQVEGLPGRLDDIENDIGDLDDAIRNLMNTSGNFAIRASALAFKGASGTTVPSSITLTAVKGAGLTGTVNWSVFAGSATLSPTVGDTTSVIGSSVTGASVTVRARLIVSGVIYDAFVTIDRLGAIAAVDKVNLTNQVTGALASGNVSGLGALALLNTVNLNTQTTGSINGQTQVTNLGALAYANAVAANQIGAGQLAAGVIYAGEINADNITSGTITGRTLRTSASGKRVEVQSGNNRISFFGSGGEESWIESSAGGDTGLTINAGDGDIFLSRRGPGAARNHTVILGAIRSNVASLLAYSNNEAASIRLLPTAGAGLPSSRAAGNICFHGGWLCFANGTDWFQSDGTKIT